LPIRCEISFPFLPPRLFFLLLFPLRKSLLHYFNTVRVCLASVFISDIFLSSSPLVPLGFTAFPLIFLMGLGADLSLLLVIAVLFSFPRNLYPFFSFFPFEIIRLKPFSSVFTPDELTREQALFPYLTVPPLFPS